MNTIIMKVNPFRPEKEVIAEAARVIALGGLVAFPTETVYGLGADAFNPRAVERIFKAKGRPLDNPLIIHIAEYEHLKMLADSISPRAKLLMQKFWPGPLTLIFKKSAQLPLVVTGGQETVAVRMPKNKVALELIRTFGGPIAAPSANLSGYPSGTIASHVLQDLGGEIDLILDAGPVEMGVESTVLDITIEPATILRPGATTIEQLERVIGRVVLGKSEKLLRRSPGTRYRHYSPKAEVILIDEKNGLAALKFLEQNIKAGKKVGVITRCPHLYRDFSPGIVIKVMSQDLDGYAKRLFAAFRELDEGGLDLIAVGEVEEKGIGVAIMDRLRKAASR